MATPAKLTDLQRRLMQDVLNGVVVKYREKPTPFDEEGNNEWEVWEMGRVVLGLDRLEWCTEAPTTTLNVELPVIDKARTTRDGELLSVSVWFKSDDDADDAKNKLDDAFRTLGVL